MTNAIIFTSINNGVKSLEKSPIYLAKKICNDFTLNQKARYSSSPKVTFLSIMSLFNFCIFIFDYLLSLIYHLNSLFVQKWNENTMKSTSMFWCRSLSKTILSTYTSSTLTLFWIWMRFWSSKLNYNKKWSASSCCWGEMSVHPALMMINCFSLHPLLNKIIGFVCTLPLCVLVFVRWFCMKIIK